MRPARLRPLRQIFVCTNRRADDDPLRSSCGAVGPGLYVALKSAVLRSSVGRDVWVTATGCLGHCPRRGGSVVIHPLNEHLVEVDASDVAAILQAATAAPQEVAR